MATAARAVLEASAAVATAADAVLALVLETDGSTYVRAGAAALFAGATRVGWLSGGCLEARIAEVAANAAAARQLHWLELDTRDDADLFDGSAPGCRGRLRLALLPLAALPGWDALVAHWASAGDPLILSLARDGALRAQCGTHAAQWTLQPASPAWDDTVVEWDLPFVAPLRVALFGAGPEAPLLLPLLRTLGFRCVLVERRARWRAAAADSDALLELAPEAALAHPALARTQAALVMHHHFEFDREALAALAPTPIEFIGLLGPTRRRDDLLRLLPADARDALQPRLRAPVGMHLGGEGPEAIALSIAAQLQAHRHGR